MKNNSIFKMLAVAGFLLFGYTAVSAQSESGAGGTEVQQDVLQDKMQHQMTSEANYDAWKFNQTQTEVAPNQVIREVTANGQTTYEIRLGFNLADEAAATQYANKIAAAPGVIQATANHDANTVEVVIKEEDEYNALNSLFDIQN